MKTRKFFNVVAIVAILGISAVFIACYSGPQHYGTLEGTEIPIFKEFILTNIDGKNYSLGSSDQQVEVAVATLNHFFVNLNSVRQEIFKKNIRTIGVRPGRTEIDYNEGYLYIPNNVNEVDLETYLETNGLLD
jgi:hypothetical protein